MEVTWWVGVGTEEDNRRKVMEWIIRWRVSEVGRGRGTIIRECVYVCVQGDSKMVKKEESNATGEKW